MQLSEQDKLVGEEFRSRLKQLTDLMTVDQLTVSHSFDTYRFGQKQSHFCSMNFKIPPNSTQREVEALHLQAGLFVARCTIHDALAQGSISIEEAKEKLTMSQTNYDNILNILVKKYIMESTETVAR
jgi:hypothetical protein